MGLFQGDFYSESLRMTTQLKVIFPDLSNDVTPVMEGEPRVLYLLHGLAANSGEWTRFSKIEYYAKKYNFIIIMPEVQRSFYCDSRSGPRYFTYVADELPRICNQWFRLSGRREKTFIAGESMGGYGAVKIGLRRPRQFGGIASLSGVLDYPGMARRILEGVWPDVAPEELTALHGPGGMPGPEEDVIALVRRAAADPLRPRLIQLCGTEDFLYKMNLSVRDQLRAMNVDLTYDESGGIHNWDYWDPQIRKVLEWLPLAGTLVDGE